MAVRSSTITGSLTSLTCIIRPRLSQSPATTTAMLIRTTNSISRLTHLEVLSGIFVRRPPFICRNRMTPRRPAAGDSVPTQCAKPYDEFDVA